MAPVALVVMEERGCVPPTAPMKIASPVRLTVRACAPFSVLLKRPVGPVMTVAAARVTGSLKRKELVTPRAPPPRTVEPPALVSRLVRPLMAPEKLVTPLVFTISEPPPLSAPAKPTLPPAVTVNRPLMVSGLMKVALPAGVMVTLPPPVVIAANWTLLPAVTLT